MDFSLTREQELLRRLAAEFAKNELEPAAADMDREHKFNTDNFRKMAELGFTGLGIPREYGGSGGKTVEKVIVVSEFAKKCLTSAATLSIHSITPGVIFRHGTIAQKQKYLPMLTEGGGLSAFALTEPGAGSDAAGVKTTAVYDKKSDEYVINGTKCFITGGARADALILFALTRPELGTRGLSAFIVEKGTPGFTGGKIEEKMGLTGSETTELIFEDCRVPSGNLVGKEGQGFKIAMEALDGARIGVGASAVGLSEGAIDLCIRYMHERVQFGRPIAALQGLQWYISEMGTKTESAKWLVYYAAYLQDSQKPFTKEAAMCKLNASETARFTANLAMQIHGGYGYIHPTLGFTSNDADPNVRINRVAKLCEDPMTRPDISPIDMGSFNFESWDAENKIFHKEDMIYHNSTETILHAAKTFQELGVITQIVCWDIGFVRRASCLAEMGIFREPLYFLFCTTGADIITGPLCTPVSVNALREALPQEKELTWCVDCCNGKLTGLIPWLAGAGGHISLGLGDDPFLELGHNTTNADVIRMAAKLARENGREIAAPEETRKMLDGKTVRGQHSHRDGERK